jgi:hypothetical protein
MDYSTLYLNLGQGNNSESGEQSLKQQSKYMIKKEVLFANYYKK